MISSLFKDMRHKRIVQLINLPTHRAFHLIKDNAVIVWLARLVKLNTNALLGKIKRIDVGKNTASKYTDNKLK